MLTQSQVDELNLLFADELLQKKKYKEKNSWESPLPRTRVGNYNFVPLVTARMLKSEGYMMKNCAHDYTEVCAIGHYIMFSVRDLNENRIATLGYKFESEAWVYDQCSGVDDEYEDIFFEKVVYCTDDNGDDCEFYNVEKDLFYVIPEVERLLNLVS